MTVTPVVQKVQNTLLTLNAAHPTVRDGVRDVQEMHRLVMSGVTGLPQGTRTARAERAVLFSTRSNPDSTISMVVQSDTPFDPSVVPAGALTGPAQSWERHLTFTTEAPYWFELVAAPTKAVMRGGKATGARGARVAILDPDEQVAWLHRVAERSGFTVNQVNVAESSELRSARKSLPRAQRAHPDASFLIRTTRFVGVLTVTDPVVFADTIRAGVGKGKAYGAGLLLTRSTQ